MTMTAETTELTFWVPEENLERLKARITKIARKASKLGTLPVSIETLSEKLEPITEGVKGHSSYKILGYRKLFEIKATGETPKIAGWTFAATLEHTPEGNILRSIPGTDLPARYREALPVCEHCDLNRRRNDTYVVQHEDGTFKQVGRNCLKDFLGGVSPERAVFNAQWLIELADGSWGESGGGSPTYFAPERYLGFVSAVIRKHGWVSRGRAYETHETSTADYALEAMFPSVRVPKEDRIAPTEADEEIAAKTVEWVKDLPGEEIARSDYLHNLSLTIKMEVIGFKQAGIAASAVTGYRRDLTKKAEKAITAASEWFGTVKKREDFTLTFMAEHSFESMYGTTYLLRFADQDGNTAIWMTSRPPTFGREGVEDLEVGQAYKVKATVKEHGEYRGGKQTVITRAKILGKIEDTDE